MVAHELLGRAATHAAKAGGSERARHAERLAQAQWDGLGERPRP